MRYCIQTLLLALLIGYGFPAHGQTQLSKNQDDTDTLKRSFLYVDRADRQLIDASEDSEKLYLMGNVRLTHDSTYMFCDTAVLYENSLSANGNISIIKNDSIRIFSDSLLYLGDSLMAYFVGNVVLENNGQQLFTSFLQYDLEKDWAIYTDTALLVADPMTIKSKRGIYHVDEQFINFYEKVTIDGDDFNLLSDSLRYYTELERAVFLSPTLIKQGNKTIYSEGGFYDIDDKQSSFFGNAQYKEEDNVSTADTIKNDENTEVIELIGNATFQSKDEVGTAEKIVFFQARDEIELIGNAFFKNVENEVSGEQITYQKATDDVKVLGRSFLSNPPMIIYADTLDYRKKQGIAFADGNVIWQDTTNKYEIVCDHARYIDSTDFMKAYNDKGKPILKNEVKEGDTLFLSGDTLISYAKVIDIDTFRYFSAFEHVEMINKEIQAISDSLSYDGRDSIFTLYGKPFMWSDSSQYNADTIVISMENNEIEQVDLLGKSLILSSEDFQFFDQIKGKKIEAVFENGAIHRMFVTGGSESVYYMKDEEKAYIGVNETQCSNMSFIFEKGELIRTHYYKEPVSKLTPMEKANHESIKLEGFIWRVGDRPKSIEDLYF